MDTWEGVDAGPLPVRVALMNDYSVVVEGLRAMLEPHSDRIEVIELDISRTPRSPVDVFLYDAFGRGVVTDIVRESLAVTGARAVLYTWNLSPQIVADCLAAGVSGCLSKSLEPHELVTAIENVHGGATVVDPAVEAEEEPMNGSWPGRSAGLSAREAEVLAYISQGLSNQQIAERAFVSINSVKSHIRSTYRKIGVERRTQAVLWAFGNGFDSRPSRTEVEAVPTR